MIASTAQPPGRATRPDDASGVPPGATMPAGCTGPHALQSTAPATTMFDAANWEVASYVVTVIGLPLAIAIFLYEQRKERRNEEDEIYQTLSDAYNDFLRVVIDNADL